MQNIISRSDSSQSMPYFLQSMSHELSQHFQISQELIIPTLLGICASMVHDKFKVRVVDSVTGGSFIEPLSLFCIGVAGSSERKSALFKWLKRPIDETIAEQNEKNAKQYSKQQCENKLALDEAKKLRRKITSLPIESPERKIKTDRLMELEEKLQEPLISDRRLFLHDSTAIAAAEFMQKQLGSGLTIADAEGSSFDAILSDHRLLELLISGFSNERVSFERSSRPSIEIHSPHTSICILTQMSKLHALAKKVSTWDEGFVPRSLIFLVPEMAGMRQNAIGAPVKADCKKWWQKQCKFFLNYPYNVNSDSKRDYHILELSQEAAQLWRQFTSDLERMMHPISQTYLLRAWLGKMGGVVARIAGIYHLFDRTSEIASPVSAISMQQACNLINTVVPHMQEVAKLYFPKDNSLEQVKHKIVNWLKQQYGTLAFFKLRDMYRELNIDVKYAKLACDQLCITGVLQVSMIQECKLGRHATPVYIVNVYGLENIYPLPQY